MKPGATTNDQAKIRQLRDEGLSAPEISEELQINLETVESFMKFDPLKAAKEEEKKFQAEQAKAAKQQAAAEAAAKAVLEAT